VATTPWDRYNNSIHIDIQWNVRMRGGTFYYPNFFNLYFIFLVKYLAFAISFEEGKMVESLRKELNQVVINTSSSPPR
jgi:hypothetical protein